DAPTHHTVASVFWAFMTSSGPVNDGFQTMTAPLFNNPFFATGYPITEAYWTTVKVGGVPKQVLVQVFERRVLTYTPSNAPGWQVETGNVGQHYFQWRYLYDGGNPLLVESLSYHQDASGKWVFIGDVRNAALGPYENVKIDVKLLDAAGSVTAEQNVFLALGALAGGQQVPFEVWFDTGQPFAGAQVSASGDPGSHVPLSNLSLIESVGSAGTGSQYRVSAVVRNDGSVPLKFVSYVVGLYDSHGWVVGYDWGIANPSTLQPHQEATLNATVLNAPSSTAGFRVFATGSP
ncbi:MAG TPA: FxLYD domain-containing protein, partial [Thermomicrobiaceae bacterium]|nr:FxLYD domain-containing protein [Thermomicrobiaceae bacterium]